MLLVKAKNIRFLHIFVIVLVGLSLTIPAVFYGVFDAHDLVPYHLKWSKHFSEQFWLGDLYPRWLLGMNAGLGGPTFFFYPPVPYYFTSLLHPLFANEAQGWHQLSLSALFALVASGITAYIWLKSITNEKSALIASIVYMALPYHIGIELYWRFAFAEYWSFVWMPLILYFAKKIVTEHRLNIVGFSVSSALLVMTHLPTLIIFYPVVIGYILLMVGKHKKRKKALICMIVAITLGIGLSAIYWLPAMTTQEYISMKAIMEGPYFYGNNFLFITPDPLGRYLEVLTLLMGGLACCAFIIARTNSIATCRRESNYWIAIAMISVFMMLPLSQPIWYLVPVIQRLQFPWRFNTVLTLAITALIALGISSLKQPVDLLNKKVVLIGFLLPASLLLSVLEVLPLLQQRFQLHWYVNSGLIVVITTIIILGISSLKVPVNLSNQKKLVIGVLLTTSLLLSSGIIIKIRLCRQVDTVNNALSVPAFKISRDAREYRPKWVSQEIFIKPEELSRLSRSSANASVTVGQGNLLIQRWKPREIVLQVNAITDVWLTINQFYYPGWTARLNGESRLLAVQPSKPEGLLRVRVPSGKREVIVTLDAGVEERAGQIISAVSAISILSFLFRFSRVD